MKLLIFLLLFSFNSHAINDYQQQLIINEIINPNDEQAINNKIKFKEAQKNFTKKIRILASNKITARSEIITAKINEKVKYGKLTIVPRVCWRAPESEKTENKALLQIFETNQDHKKEIFSGWMFSSSPSLSTVEHALYDVNLLECIN